MQHSKNQHSTFQQDRDNNRSMSPVSQIDPEQQERMKVGLGKRLNLKEILLLSKWTKQECVTQMGMGYMPIGTKAPVVSYLQQ